MRTSRFRQRGPSAPSFKTSTTTPTPKLAHRLTGALASELGVQQMKKETMAEQPKLSFKDRMSFSMTEARAAKWAISRKEGKKKFILKVGVLSWGIPMFVVMTFFVNKQPNQELTPLLIAGSAVIWALGGAFFGWMMWTLGERQYQKFNLKKSER